MITLLCAVLAILALPFKSKIQLEAENAALRHQLIVLRRSVRWQRAFACWAAGALHRIRSCGPGTPGGIGFHDIGHALICEP